MHLQKNYEPKRAVASIAILSAIFAIAACFFGELVLPVAAAYLAALFLFEAPKRKIVSILLPVALLILSVFFGITAVFSAVEAIVLALILVLTALKFRNKRDTVFLLSVVYLVFFLLSLIVAAAEVQGTLSLSAIADYYGGYYAGLKTQFIKFFSETAIPISGGDSVILFDAESAEKIFNEFILILPSVLIGFSFLLAVITAKIAEALAYHYGDPVPGALTGGFFMTSLTGYGYLILALVSFFLNTEDPTGAVLFNLSVVLMFPYVWIGLKMTFLFAKKIRRTGGAVFFLIFGTLLFSVFFLRLLSYIGAIANIVYNRSLPDEPETPES